MTRFNLPNLDSNGLVKTKNLPAYLQSAALQEMVRDTIGAALVAGTGITVSPNDAADTITIGNSAPASSSGSVAGYAADTPALHGLKEWNYSPALTGTGAGVAPSSGVAYFARLVANSNETVSTIHVIEGTLGSGLSKCYLGLYGPDGTLLSSSAESSSSFTSNTGDTPVALAQSVNLTAGELVFAAFVCTGSTMPAIVRGPATGSSGPNVGLSASQATPYMFGSFGSGLSALPSTLPFASTSPSTLSMWVGLA